MSDLSGRQPTFTKLCTSGAPKTLDFQSQAHHPPEAILTRLERNQNPCQGGNPGAGGVVLELVLLPKPLVA